MKDEAIPLGEIIHQEIANTGQMLLDEIKRDQDKDAPPVGEALATMHYTVFASIHAGEGDGTVVTIARCKGGMLEQTTNLFQRPGTS